MRTRTGQRRLVPRGSRPTTPTPVPALHAARARPPAPTEPSGNGHRSTGPPRPGIWIGIGIWIGRWSPAVASAARPTPDRSPAGTGAERHGTPRLRCRTLPIHPRGSGDRPSPHRTDRLRPGGRHRKGRRWRFVRPHTCGPAPPTGHAARQPPPISATPPVDFAAYRHPTGATHGPQAALARRKPVHAVVDRGRSRRTASRP